jgi:DNA-binding MarR family transcriptional regulator
MTTTEAPRAASTEQVLQLTQTIVRRLHDADLDSWCAVDLTMSQLKALFLARPPQGASHGEIARALGVGLSTVTGVVDRLVEQGLVVRCADPDDRRLSHVVATALGTDMIDRLWGSRLEFLRQLLYGLTPDERAGFQAALEHFARLISEPRAPGN